MPISFPACDSPLGLASKPGGGDARSLERRRLPSAPSIRPHSDRPSFCLDDHANRHDAGYRDWLFTADRARSVSLAARREKLTALAAPMTAHHWLLGPQRRSHSGEHGHYRLEVVDGDKGADAPPLGFGALRPGQLTGDIPKRCTLQMFKTDSSQRRPRTER
jgi:hypothetical protein